MDALQYATEARFKSDPAELYELVEHETLDAAVEYAAYRNANEPHPNIAYGDDVELIWTVVSRPVPAAPEPWAPVPTPSDAGDS